MSIRGLVWPLFLGLAALAQDVSLFTSRLDAEVPGYLAKYRVPGVGVALIRNGEVIYLRGFGMADVAGSLPTTQTGFNIGSISKTVAAWGLMKLVEQGKLDLDAPVSRYLTRWQIPESDFDPAGVTLRRLLSHTAGISLHGYPGFGPNDTLPSIVESLNGATNGSGPVTIVHEPGSKWQYSGGGYTIAQLLVEEVTGKPFADYMREAILEPLGMHHSDYFLSPTILAHSAKAYDELGGETPNPRFTAMAAAGLHTRVSGVQVDQEISLLRNIIAHGFLGGEENEDMKIVKVDGRTTPFTVERRELTTGYLDELTEKVSSLKEEIEQVLIPLIGDSSKVLTI